jgi:hypothetical protein
MSLAYFPNWLTDFKLPFDGTILSDPNCAKNLGVFFDNK